MRRLLGSVFDFLVPARQERGARRRRAVFREVIVNELDAREVRRAGRGLRILVRRHLIRDLGVWPDHLRIDRQRPVVELLGVV